MCSSLSVSYVFPESEREKGNCIFTIWFLEVRGGVDIGVSAQLFLSCPAPCNPYELQPTRFIVHGNF